jgi:hypothetical protein
MFSGLDNGLIVAFIKQIQFNLHPIDISRNKTDTDKNAIATVNTTMEAYRNNMAHSKYKIAVINTVIESNNTFITFFINKITADSLKIDIAKNNMDVIGSKIAAETQPISQKTQQIVGFYQKIVFGLNPEILTAKHAKYANGIPRHFAYLACCAVENFPWRRFVADDGADTAPLPPMMPPRRGWGIFGLGFYKDVAPTALIGGAGIGGIIKSLD